jgi:hypothetical protein
MTFLFILSKDVEDVGNTWGAREGEARETWRTKMGDAPADLQPRRRPLDDDLPLRLCALRFLTSGPRPDVRSFAQGLWISA